jgi:hypothetical protein
MSYIGNQPFNTAFQVDTFSGNGSTTSFNLSLAPASPGSILVTIGGILQDVSAYGVSGRTLNFSGIPPTGTNNISVRYLGLPASNVTTTAYRTVTDLTAVAGQTTFSVSSYTPGFIDVYRNGVKLAAADFTATNGAQVVLASPAFLGDTIQTVSFYVSGVSNAIPGITGSVGPAYLQDGGVTASKLDVVSSTGTGAMRLPTGTTAQRGSAPGQGAIRFNSSTGFPEIYTGSAWSTIAYLGDGSSYSNAAASAQVIKTLTGTTTSGYYWIFVGGNPTQVWCDMSDSTAWMLLMRASSGGTTFSYDSVYWQNGATGLNDTGNPLTNIDMKQGVLWNSAIVTNLRLTGSTSATAYNANPLTFGTFGVTTNIIFNAGANTWDAQVGYTRAQWLAWGAAAAGAVASNFDTQPNCNTTTINNTGTGPYARIRIGWCGNNENDCGTNDSWAGIGGYWNSAQLNGGAQSWSPAVYTPCHLWLWMN